MNFRNSSREMDQNFDFEGTLGYGDWYSEFLFCHFEVIRLHAILHDAARAVRAKSGKGFDYCYMIGRGPNSSLVVHVSRLLFCHYVKLFLPSISNSVTFWSSMSILVLDIWLAEKKFLGSCEFLIMGTLRDTHSILQKSTNRRSKHFGVQEICTEKCWTVVVGTTVSFRTFPIKKLKPKNSQKETEKGKILGSLMDKEEKILVIVAVSKYKNLLNLQQMKTTGFVRVTNSDIGPQITVQSASQNCFVTGQCKKWR